MNILKQLSLADHDGNVSLSNMSMYAAMIMFVLSATGVIPPLPPEQLAMVVGFIANYAHKRQFIASSKAQEQAQILEQEQKPVPTTEVDQLKIELESLKSAVSFLRKGK